MRWIQLAFLIASSLLAAWLVGANLSLLWELIADSSSYAWRLAGAAALVPVTGVTAAWILWSRRRPLAACCVTLGWMALQMSGLPWRLVS
jgi:hypothetical protein